MESWEDAAPAERQTGTRQAICWECGQERECFEYTVCCTGTIFHICPTCEAAVDNRPDEPADDGESAPDSTSIG